MMMKTTRIMTAAMLIGATAMAAAAGRHRHVPTPDGEYICGHQAAAMAHFSGGGSPPPIPLRGAEDTDVLHYHLDIEVRPSTEWLGGSNTMTVRSEVDGLTTFVFWLHTALGINALDVDGVPASWTRLNDREIEVTLPTPQNIGDEFDLTVAYEGFPQSLNWGSIVFTTHAGQDLVYTLSQPWYAYTWWPVKEDNTDKATGVMAITVPDTMSVASNGLLTSEEPVGGGKVQFVWETNYKTPPYLFAFAATNYDRWGTTWNHGDIAMPLDFYVFPEDNTGGNQAKMLAIGDMLTSFSGIYGTYPFSNEKYGVYQFGFGGGMEHQTMSGQGGFALWLSAHELGHQWWGDMLTCDTWHDIWLNEGLATYSEALWEEFKPGGSEQAMLQTMYNDWVNNWWDSVYVYDISDPGRIFQWETTYKKASWTFHMLRHVLGSDVFFDVLAEYRTRHEYATATTAEFQSAAEDVSGRDLDWYFDTWVYDNGMPDYRWAYQHHEVGGAHFVELYVQQVQASGQPIFTMPIDMHVSGSPDAVVPVWNDALAEHLLLAVDGVPSAVEFDPKFYILRHNDATTAWVDGPPKVVHTSPEPGAILADGRALTEIEAVLHVDAPVAEADVTVTGGDGQPIAVEVAYDASQHRVTITPLGAIAPGDVTVTIADSVVSAAAGIALDGETAHVWTDEPLPSGDGLAGGDLTWSFVITPPGDLDGDGDVDLADLGILLASFEVDDGGDLDGDGDTDLSDLGILLASFGFGT
jgi:aminopeptidase N